MVFYFFIFILFIINEWVWLSTCLFLHHQYNQFLILVNKCFVESYLSVIWILYFIWFVRIARMMIRSMSCTDKIWLVLLIQFYFFFFRFLCHQIRRVDPISAVFSLELVCFVVFTSLQVNLLSRITKMYVFLFPNESMWSRGFLFCFFLSHSFLDASFALKFSPMS